MSWISCGVLSAPPPSRRQCMDCPVVVSRTSSGPVLCCLTLSALTFFGANAVLLKFNLCWTSVTPPSPFPPFQLWSNTTFRLPIEYHLCLALLGVTLSNEHCSLTRRDLLTLSPECCILYIEKNRTACMTVAARPVLSNILNVSIQCLCLFVNTLSLSCTRVTAGLFTCLLHLRNSSVDKF